MVHADAVQDEAAQRLAEPLPNRNPPTASLMAALRAEETMSTLIRAWACSTADTWVNDTT